MNTSMFNITLFALLQKEAPLNVLDLPGNTFYVVRGKEFVVGDDDNKRGIHALEFSNFLSQLLANIFFCS